LLWDRTPGDWRAESITWLRDFQAFYRVSGADIGDETTWATLAHSPYFVIMNVAVGGFFPVCFHHFSTQTVADKNTGSISNKVSGRSECRYPGWLREYVGGFVRSSL
jgi:beta-glucanase (GH16 family)